MFGPREYSVPRELMQRQMKTIIDVGIHVGRIVGSDVNYLWQMKERSGWFPTLDWLHWVGVGLK